MKISKFAKFMLAGALILGIFGLKEAATPQKAEAAYDYYDCLLTNCYPGIDRPHNMFFSTDVTDYYKRLSTYVEAEIDVYGNLTYYWDMKIQKKYSGVWQTYTPAAAKSGYVSEVSPSSRVWSMSDFTTGEYRVWMKITSSSDGKSYSNWVYGTPFYVNP